MLELFSKKMALFYDNPVINWHEHVWEIKPGVLNKAAADRLAQAARDMGMDKLLISCPITTDPYCPPERFGQANDIVAEAVRLHPDVFLGMCFVNPGYQEATIREVKRCVQELGMVGVKLYHQYFIDDPVQFPLIESCLELDVPILMHAGKLTVNPQAEVHLSDGTHFARVARRYPEAKLIMAHICGGGDWIWSLKAIADYPNIMTDTSGSVVDRPVLEQAVAMLGAERLLFGTDGSVSAGIGKLLGADLTLAEKKTILAGPAYSRFLKRGAGR